MTSSLSEKIILFFAFGFGTGLAKIAPGTWGTIPGIFIAYWLIPSPIWHLVITGLLFIVGCWLCERASAILRVHDHGGIVIDEIVGVCIALLFVPVTWSNLLLGFVLFRFFDIIKPWPIRWVDRRVHGGIGIMLDDVIAGLFAAILLHVGLWLFA